MQVWRKPGIKSSVKKQCVDERNNDTFGPSCSEDSCFVCYNCISSAESCCIIIASSRVWWYKKMFLHVTWSSQDLSRPVVSGLYCYFQIRLSLCLLHIFSAFFGAIWQRRDLLAPFIWRHLVQIGPLIDSRFFLFVYLFCGGFFLKKFCQKLHQLPFRIVSIAAAVRRHFRAHKGRMTLSTGWMQTSTSAPTLTVINGSSPMVN
jgi:hypothetical protein